jgi:hypothetical protein
MEQMAQKDNCTNQAHNYMDPGHIMLAWCLKLGSTNLESSEIRTNAPILLLMFYCSLNFFFFCYEGCGVVRIRTMEFPNKTIVHSWNHPHFEKNGKMHITAPSGVLLRHSQINVLIPLALYI